MKKKLFFPLFLFLLAALLLSCSPASAVIPPEGMQVAYEGDGYTFFAPEDWEVTVTDGIATAKVSAVEHTNISCAVFADARTATAYFADGEAELAARLPDYTPLPAESSNNASLGGVGAVCRVYTATVQGTPYKFMQIAASRGGRIFLLTYTAQSGIVGADVTYFGRFYETALKTAAVFSFEGNGQASPADEGEADEEGMILISDPAVVPYSLYVPKTWTKDRSDGMTSASVGTDAAITLHYAIPEEKTVGEYWENRMAAYRELLPDFAVVDAECSVPATTEDEVEEYLDGHAAVRYVYTYTVNGTPCKTCEIMTIDSIYIYTITYTAKADAFETYRGDWDKIRARFTFD